MSIVHGTRLGSRYEILLLLGAGGMGEVYRAKDLTLKREVAIKVLPSHLLQDPNALSRFEREAKALAALSHINILTIYDFGVNEGISFAVMELLNGETLRSFMQHSDLPWNKAIEISTAIAEGLAAAHSASVIHRDLKPENVFITQDGTVKILDFGLARMETKTSPQAQTSMETISRTQDGVVMGTLPYMSPEQVRGNPVDVRTDIFSFGCLLFEMLTGKNPFARETSSEVVAAILRDNPTLPNEKVPVELNQVVQHCLEKNPDNRFQTARDLTFALKSVSSGTSSATLGKANESKFLPFKWITSSLAIAAIIAVSIYFFKDRREPMKSLAILPFANSSTNPEAEYLSDGITESIINNMSELPNLHVMARGTVFTYKGKDVDPRKVGQDLKVEAVVTGRVMQQGDTLVVRADLVNVADGTQMWGTQFNRKLADVLSVQDEISKEIASKLRFRLTGEQTKRLTKRYTEKAEAYQFYLKGMYHWYKNTEDDYEKAHGYFQQAIEIDPAYALAYAGISRYYGGMIMDGYRSPKEMWSKLETAARKALQLDKNLSHGKFELAAMKFYRDWDWPESERLLREILEDDPNDALFYHLHSYVLIVMGRREEAIQQIKKCESLDPLSLVFSVNVGQLLSMSGRHDEAIQQLRKAIDLNPDYETAVFSLADAYQRKGNYDEAIEASEKGYRLLEDESTAELFAQANGKEGYQKAVQVILRDTLNQYLELSQERYISPLDMASIYSQLHEKDEAFLYLEKAFEEKSGQLVFLNLEADWDPLRSDPRFTELTKRIGLP